MYQALLTRRYLFSKIMPLLAAIAVMLCTAMVLIVWSVMGGFLTMLLGSARTLQSDVTILWPNTGFPYYEELIADLEADKAYVAAAAPMIETFALSIMPNERTEMITLRAIDGHSFNNVTSYYDTLWWRPLAQPLPKDKDGEDLRTEQNMAASLNRMLQAGKDLQRTNSDTGELEDAIVPGIELSGFNERNVGGWYVPLWPVRRLPDGTRQTVQVFMPRDGSIRIHIAPLDSEGRAIEGMIARDMPVANEFRTGMYTADRNIAFARLNAIQSMLKMNAAPKVEATHERGSATVTNPDGSESFELPRVTGEEPARVTHVLVRAADGVTPDQLKQRTQSIYEQFAARHRAEVPDPMSILVFTWMDQNREYVVAVQTETTLVLFIFGFISLTAVFLVLAIFWSMVSEKTREIGVLRSLGASRLGVAWLWMRYGLALGIVGTTLGLCIAVAIVWNINPIHEQLGKSLGLVIWDPKIYYFTKIPNQVEFGKAAAVAGIGIFSALVGSLWPAIRAARMDPVQSLRYE